MSDDQQPDRPRAADPQLPTWQPQPVQPQAAPTAPARPYTQAPAQPSPYGQAPAPQSPYGQPAPPSPYGQAPGQPSPYGQPSAPPSPYGQAAPTPAPQQNPYGQQPASAAYGASPYTQVPAASGAYGSPSAQVPPVPTSPYAPTPAYAPTPTYAPTPAYVQDAYGQPTRAQTPLAPQADSPSRFSSYSTGAAYPSGGAGYGGGGYGAGGFAAGYAAGGYSQPAYGYGGRADYASWGARVGAFLIDMVPVIVFFTISAFGSAVFTTPGYDAYGYPTAQPTGGSLAVGLGGYAIALGFQIWNRYIRQGRTGQSLGKQALGIRLVREDTMAPPGAAMAFGREFAHNIDSMILYIGYLWPLWDPKSQTLADKICSTIVVKA